MSQVGDKATNQQLQLESPALAPSLPDGSRGDQPLCFVIDDEPGIQNIVSNAAGGLGFCVARFRSAAKALAALKSEKPSLVFLDVSLEQSDAIDVIRGFGSAGFRGTVQLMSGKDAVTLDEVKRVGEGRSLMMLPPLRKPFRLDDVRAVIKNHLASPQKREDSPDVKAAPAPNFTGQIDIEAMLRKNLLELWYQPKIDLRKMQFAGAEGLIRCRHPERGILSPASFLPYADDSSMMRITEMVLRKALTDWEKFAQAGFPFKLAVNVPVKVLLKLPIHLLVREHRSNREDWPGMILEVTEDQVVRDISQVREIATQLRIHDIVLAIDDFGTGYSHLARLKEFPFAELKIDRSLVMNCGENKDNASLCQAAIDLAHRFGTAATAEGIETTSELKTLVKMQCDFGQGYLFAKPMPRDNLLSSLVKHTAHNVPV
jgi:EAL domain-containing protein (putative c-di-GMP-specific phosphodiesterase class I)/CheY-like chemotaxis protein